MSEMLFWVTTLLPTKKVTMTKANQPIMAFLRCRPLQQAIRAAKLCGGGGGGVAPPFPDASGRSGSGSLWMMRVFIAVPLGVSGLAEPLTRTRRAEAGKLPGPGAGFLVSSLPACESGAQEQQHRQYAARFAAGGRQPELSEDARDVFLDRAQRDHQRVGDPLIRAARGHQLEHLALARRQLGEGIVASPPREQARHDDRVDRRAARSHALHGGDELLDVADAVLEQVPHPIRGVGEQLHRQSKLDVLRQHEHRHRGVARTDLERRPQAFVVVGRGQSNVHDRDIQVVAARFAEELVGVLALSDYFEAGVAQEAGKPLAQQHAVLGDGYPHGISALTRVPPPRGVQTRRRPPSASTRSASPRRPLPPSLSAPPTPSSTTSTTSAPFRRATSTVAELASACLPTFARLSQTT